ncbi:MAG: hypothetical protein QXU73_01385 [Thermoplasmata archaeon]
MAKKIRKVPASPLRIAVDLLVPWVFMAIGAVVGHGLGLSQLATVGLALAFALGATVGVYYFERHRRISKLRRARDDSSPWPPRTRRT